MDACEKLNTTPMPSNAEAIANADVVILAVKPKMIADAMQECRDLLAASDKWIVSVAWGIDCEELENFFRAHIIFQPSPILPLKPDVES